MREVPIVAGPAVCDRVTPAGGGCPVELRLLQREAWIEGGCLHAVARWSLADLAVRTTVVVTCERTLGRAEIDLYDTLHLVWRRLDALQPTSLSPLRVATPIGRTGSMLPAPEGGQDAPTAEAHDLCIDVEGDLLALGAAILQAACVIDDDEDG